MSSVLILGARSDIARACAQFYAKQGYAVQLAARDPAGLEADATDLHLRHRVPVTCHAFDVLDTASFAGFIEALPILPDTVICAVGFMGEQAASERDPQAAALVMRSNYEGPSLILGLLAERFADRNSGTLVGISSVAGDRGRASNYVYGSAKAGFTAFLSGLRNRLSRTRVQVITVKPGFVATRMTEGMDLNPRLTAQPDEVARAIWTAQAKGRSVIYVRGIWRLVMTIIRLLPEAVFKKTSL
ncbi:SDR family oxidoreductase [Pararhodobacter zhoushanensis]|uniref:SDR family oxidoreductase n=1 Tax=Pararhodobacter zhoushanensis TaxID=2479545 RepID=A0ABT3H010_9RHOB|nr:SDR family oxidoreductase [Pararhodobacter zhoushanensis]MCW1933122.1 SDR family oxidoreductase [Pararhodobacter zhoushanensis]